jgi:AcrR family transcriptional regulator
MTLQPSRASSGDTPPDPLPRGPHRLPFEYVVEDQRRRLLAGVGTALADHDYTALTVKHVIEAAGVSRAAFDANFDNKRDCVLAARLFEGGIEALDGMEPEIVQLVLMPYLGVEEAARVAGARAAGGKRSQRR